MGLKLSTTLHQMHRTACRVHVSELVPPLHALRHFELLSCFGSLHVGPFPSRIHSADSFR